MYSLFFEIIRVAIGTQQSLSRLLLANEWDELFELTKKQSLVGVCFAGVQKIRSISPDHPIGSRQVPEGNKNMPEQLYLTWMGMSAIIQQRNEGLNNACFDLQKKLECPSVLSSILKGQGIAALYGNLSNLRQPGDIDIYVSGGRENAIMYAAQLGHKNVQWDYKHLHFNLPNGTVVEMHYRPEFLFNPWRNFQLQKFWKKYENEFFHKDEEHPLVTPSPRMNAFYVLLHIYRHLFSGGIGLKQVIDYYFVLKSNCFSELDRLFWTNAIHKFGMIRFARAIMWILKDVFGLSEEKLLCDVDEKEGRFLLHDIMQSGNFGQYDKRICKIGKSFRLRYFSQLLQHNIHLILHYPSETFFAPIYFVWHWCWKRMVSMF